MATDKKFFVAFKADTKALKDAYKQLSDLASMGNKVAKSFQGITLGKPGVGGTGAISKALATETKAFTDLGDAGKKMAKIFNDDVAGATEKAKKALADNATELEKLIKKYEIFSKLKYKDPDKGAAEKEKIVAELRSAGLGRMQIKQLLGGLTSGADGPAKAGLLSRVFGADVAGALSGRFTSMAIGGVAGAGIGGPMGSLLGAGLGAAGMGAAVGAAILVAKKVIESVVRTPEVAWQSGAALGQAQMGQMGAVAGDYNFEMGRNAIVSNPVLDERFRQAGTFARWGGTIRGAMSYLNPFAWGGENQERWSIGAAGMAGTAAELDKQREIAEMERQKNPAQYMQQEALKAMGPRIRSFERRFGEGSFNKWGLDVTQGGLVGSVPGMMQEEWLGLPGAMAARGGQRWAGGQHVGGLAHALTPFFAAGWDPSAVAASATRSLAGGTTGLGGLGHLDPMMGQMIANAGAGMMTPSGVAASLNPVNAAMAFGVGGGPLGMLQTEQNIQGMGAWGRVAGGFDNLQQARNLATAVGAMPSGSTYEQGYLAKAMSDPKVLANVMAGQLTPEMMNMGITKDMAKQMAQEYMTGISSRYIDQGTQTPSAQAMRTVQSKFGGNAQAYVKAEYSKGRKFGEAAVQQLAPMMEMIAPGLGEETGGWEGMLRVGAGMESLADAKKRGKGGMPELEGKDPEAIVRARQTAGVLKNTEAVSDATTAFKRLTAALWDAVTHTEGKKTPADIAADKREAQQQAAATAAANKAARAAAGLPQ